jgi:hypothetical protein
MSYRQIVIPNIKESLTKRIIGLLKFPDDKWRSLYLDDTSKEVLLPLIKNRLVDLNMYEVDESECCSIKINYDGTFRLDDLLAGIYPYQDHCFHLNGHGDHHLVLARLAEICKLNITDHPKEKLPKSPFIILSRSSKPTLVIADTYHTMSQLNMDDETWKQLRYLSIDESMEKIKLILTNLRQRETEFQKHTDLSHLITDTTNIRDHEQKKREIHFHVATLSNFLDHIRYTFCDLEMETKIEKFVQDNKDCPRIGKSLCSLKRHKPTLLIYITDGFTLREVDLASRLMIKHNVNIILGGYRILYP